MEKPEVRSNTFLRHDIQSILRAIDAGNAELATYLPVPEVAIYRAGFVAALQAVAKAFDVHLEPQSPPWRPDHECTLCLATGQAARPVSTLAECLPAGHTDPEIPR